MGLNFGDKAKDIITGFEGIVIARHLYATGCNKVTLQPQECKDGKPVDSQWFDEQHVLLLQAGVIVFKNVVDDRPTPGGPLDMPRPAPMPR